VVKYLPLGRSIWKTSSGRPTTAAGPWKAVSGSDPVESRLAADTAKSEEPTPWPLTSGR
jgi:hypothetical protein